MGTLGLPWTVCRFPYIPATCAECGAVFVARMRHHRYCSPRCADDARHRTYYRRHRTAILARMRVRRLARKEAS